VKKILKYALSVCLISLTLSCCTESWLWKPNPYATESISQSIIDKEGDIVLCSDIEFDNRYCFTTEEMEALKIEIDKAKKCFASKVK